MSVASLLSFKRYIYIQTKPDMAQLFGHHCLLLYVECGGKSKYCVIGNFCSQACMSATWGWCFIGRGGGVVYMRVWLLNRKFVVYVCSQYIFIPNFTRFVRQFRKKCCMFITTQCFPHPNTQLDGGWRNIVPLIATRFMNIQLSWLSLAGIVCTPSRIASNVITP
jgi:hypothetical protein